MASSDSPSFLFVQLSYCFISVSSIKQKLHTKLKLIVMLSKKLKLNIKAGQTSAGPENLLSGLLRLIIFLLFFLTHDYKSLQSPGWSAARTFVTGTNGESRLLLKRRDCLYWPSSKHCLPAQHKGDKAQGSTIGGGRAHSITWNQLGTNLEGNKHQQRES